VFPLKQAANRKQQQTNCWINSKPTEIPQPELRQRSGGALSSRSNEDFENGTFKPPNQSGSLTNHCYLRDNSDSTQCNWVGRPNSHKTFKSHTDSPGQLIVCGSNTNELSCINSGWNTSLTSMSLRWISMHESCTRDVVLRATILRQGSNGGDVSLVTCKHGLNGGQRILSRPWHQIWWSELNTQLIILNKRVISRRSQDYVTKVRVRKQRKWCTSDSLRSWTIHISIGQCIRCNNLVKDYSKL